MPATNSANVMPIRILLADDHHLVRAGIASLLNGHPEFEIVGSTGSGEEAIQLIAETKPDVALLDIAMPGVTGFQILARIREQGSPTKVIMLSMHADQEHINSAMSLGADGYVIKTSAPEELLLAIRKVLLGGMWLPPSISRQMLDLYLDQVRKSHELTARQSTVLKMTVDGMRTKEIAFALDISVKTVETYRTQMMHKLGLQDIPSLVRYAIRNGLAEL
ncbi:MAG: response regulator transcription factor [Ferribacterium limneticum]|jgi:DNA-binding NarL/FixJ family response regulator